MHNAAFRNLGIAGRYGRYLLEDGKKLKEKILSLKISGCNITVPFKEDAFLACDNLDKFAQKIEAVNTIKIEEGKLFGYNTDGEGFFHSLEDFQKHERFLILGAGGTAKSIAFSLKERNKTVKIINRSKKRLDYFEKNGFDTATWDEFSEYDFDIVVNTTSAGLEDDALPFEAVKLAKIFENTSLAFDCIYGKETPFLRLAKNSNNTTKDGKEMLLNQGVLAFDIFTNHAFEKSAIKTHMQEALPLA